MDINPLNQLYKDFIIILNESVVKYKSIADKYETAETARTGDMYVKASLKEDTYNTYYKYDKKVIETVISGIDENTLELYSSNRQLIPYEYRDTILLLQRQKIIDEYEEHNNYYRKYNGLPDIEDTDVFYVDTSLISDQYTIPDDIPIQDLDDSYIAILESIGYLKTLRSKYPTKEYLNYLGTNKISLVISRTAKNFGFMKIPYSISESMWNSVSTIYDQCREYFMSCIYIPEYKQTIDYYDNFIALCIMVMTLQQIMSRVIKTTIERDFFDPYCVKILFNVYGVPYNGSMDSSTLSQIVKNLNLLIQNKGTNKVIFDIAAILGFDRLKIFKYYLMKTQKFYKNGAPVVVYTTDEEGNEVPDYQSMFDIYFQKVSIGDIDTYKSLIDVSSKIPYSEVVEDDPFWVQDKALMDELYESEYNFVESKYMGVSISYKMTHVLFDNLYLLKLILDNKSQISTIMIDLPKINSYAPISLFDTIVMLCAMTCKQNSLKGEILCGGNAMSKIMHVMGFDFNKDYANIRNDIANDPNLDDNLMEFFSNPIVKSANDINRLYNNYKGLYDFILDKMTKTNDIEVYRSYSKFYYSIFYTNENNKIFNIGTETNPVYADTFMDYLHHVNVDLYDFINSIDRDTIYQYIDHIIARLTNIIDDVKYLGMMSDSASTVETMLVDLIRFFKSYTTDMIGLDMIYVYDIKPETIIRLMDKIKIYAEMVLPEDVSLSYVDDLNFISESGYNDSIAYIDALKFMTASYGLFDTKKFSDRLYGVQATYLPIDKQTWEEKIQFILENLRIDAGIMLNDLLTIYNVIKHKTKMTFTDFATVCQYLAVKDRHSFTDMISNIKSLKITDKLSPYYDKISTVIVSTMSDMIKFRDMLRSVTDSRYNSEYAMYDAIATICYEAKHADKFMLKDKIIISYE